MFRALAISTVCSVMWSVANGQSIVFPDCGPEIAVPLENCCLTEPISCERAGQDAPVHDATDVDLSLEGFPLGSASLVALNRQLTVQLDADRESFRYIVDSPQYIFEIVGSVDGTDFRPGAWPRGISPNCLDLIEANEKQDSTKQEILAYGRACSVIEALEVWYDVNLLDLSSVRILTSENRARNSARDRSAIMTVISVR